MVGKGVSRAGAAATGASPAEAAEDEVGTGEAAGVSSPSAAATTVGTEEVAAA